MNPGLNIFKKAQRLQGGKEDVSPDPDEKLKDLLSQYDEAIAKLKRENALDEAFARRALEIPPILKKFPGQYQDYFPTEHEEVPIKRSQGRRHFAPGSLGEYPIMAQGGVGEVRDKISPFAEGGKWWWEKPQVDEQGRDADLAHLTPDEQAQEQRDWDENIKSILAITPNLTPEERDQVLRLNPKDWDDSTAEKVGQASEQAGKSTLLQRGTGNVMDLERGNWPVSEEELRTLPDWLAHLLRGIPEKHTHGSQREQFMPRSVPVIQGPQGRYYDPNYSRDDERIMAKEGDADIEPLKLASGSSNLPKGFTAFWPGGGRWEDPSRVAAGSNILGGHPWQYYDIGNPNAPWIGLEGPRGSLGEWVNIPGESRRGRVIDVKQKGYGGYGILKKGQYDRKGSWIPGTGGGGGGGTIPGGPFQGWTPEAMGQWHEGTPPSQMGYQEFTGNTAGPGGQQLAYETTSYNVPGYGWVPRATLANAQASNNLWDYLNPFGGTTKGGAGTGVPTQKAIGTAVGTLSNFALPGSGYITGPIARYITSLFQKHPNITREEVVQAVQAKVKENPAMMAPPPAPAQGSGTDPWGNPDTSGRWSEDFGRGFTGGPNNTSNLGGVGFNVGGSGTVGTRAGFSTAIGFGGSYGGGSNAGDTSRFAGGAGYSRPYTSQQWANLPGSMKYPAPTLSNAFGGVTPRLSYEDYLAGFHAPGTVGSSTGPGGAAYSGGGPQGIGGGKTSFKPNLNQKVFAMGTSDVNPGLKIFHTTQLKRKKQTQ